MKEQDSATVPRISVGASSDQSIQSVVADTIKEHNDELVEREERKNNIVVFHAPKPNTNLKEQRKKDDLGLFMEINKICENDIEEKDIESIIRLGKKRDSHDENARPLLIKMKHADHKKNLFMNLQKLRDQDDPYKSMRIDHDQTQKQRDELAKLFKETEERQKSEEGPFIYRVHGPPWNRRIAKLKKQQ